MNRSILRLAVPFVISNITVPLLGAVDTALMGHMGSTAHLGAVGLAGSIFNILFWSFAFLRMALGGLVAQAFGQSNSPETCRLLFRSLAIGMAGAILLLVFQSPIADFAFFLADADATVSIHARSYFHIRIWAAPATIGLYAFMGWFIGMQDAKTPMMISIIINVVNLAGSTLFVLGLGMTAKGVALGTLIAQYIGFGIAVFILSTRYRKAFHRCTIKDIFEGAPFKRFFSANRDIFFRTLAILLTLTYYNMASAALGTEVLGMNVIFLQFIFMFSFVVDGFANAAEALSGRYIGAQNRPLFIKTVKRLLLFGAVFAFIYTAVYILFFETICRIFTKDESVIAMARTYLPWMAVLPLCSFGAFVFDGIYLGAAATRAQRNITAAASIVFFATMWISKLIAQEPPLLFGLLIFFVARSLLLALFFKRMVFAPSFK